LPGDNPPLDVWRLEKAWRDLKSIRHDINGGYYDWALFKAYKTVEMALSTICGDGGYGSLLDMYDEVSRICGGDEGVYSCIEVVMVYNSDCFGRDPRLKEPMVKCTLEHAIDSLRCSRRVLEWVEECVRERL